MAATATTTATADHLMSRSAVTPHAPRPGPRRTGGTASRTGAASRATRSAPGRAGRPRRPLARVVLVERAAEVQPDLERAVLGHQPVTFWRVRLAPGRGLHHRQCAVPEVR